VCATKLSDRPPVPRLGNGFNRTHRQDRDVCATRDLEIDNNGAERSLRGVAVGRKNWLFFGSDNGGRTAAVLTSFVAPCKRLGLDPFAYLRDVFGGITRHPASRLAELLPDQWRTARRAAADF
jgi:transposase